MLQGLLAVGGVVWFGVAGLGLGFLLEGPLRGPVQRALRSFKIADGQHHVEPGDDETERWTRRWSKIIGFVIFFTVLFALSATPLTDSARNTALVVFGGVVPALGYTAGWRHRHR